MIDLESPYLVFILVLNMSRLVRMQVMLHEMTFVQLEWKLEAVIVVLIVTMTLLFVW